MKFSIEFLTLFVSLSFACQRACAEATRQNSFSAATDNSASKTLPHLDDAQTNTNSGKSALATAHVIEELRTTIDELHQALDEAEAWEREIDNAAQATKRPRRDSTECDSIRGQPLESILKSEILKECPTLLAEMQDAIDETSDKPGFISWFTSGLQSKSKGDNKNITNAVKHNIKEEKTERNESEIASEYQDEDEDEDDDDDEEEHEMEEDEDDDDFSLAIKKLTKEVNGLSHDVAKLQKLDAAQKSTSNGERPNASRSFMRRFLSMNTKDELPNKEMLVERKNTVVHKVPTVPLKLCANREVMIKGKCVRLG